jgi:hypothetical protein
MSRIGVSMRVDQYGSLDRVDRTFRGPVEF